MYCYSAACGKEKAAPLSGSRCDCGRSDQFDRAVVVAVVAVRVVQVPIDEVIDVVAMWHRFVTAAGAMDVSCFVAAAVVVGRAGVRVGGADSDAVFIDVAAVRVVQVAVVQVVNVAVVLDGGVAAARAVLVRVVGVVRFVAAAAAVVFAHV